MDLYVLATGASQVGLAYNSSGLTAYYSFAGTNATSHAITLATLAAVTSAWSSGGFIKLDDTNMPGVYRFDVPDAVLAASKGREVIITFNGYAGMAPRHIKLELTGWDNQDVVNVGKINGISTSSVTSINAHIGTLQDVVFLGTGSNATVKSALYFWNGYAVQTNGNSYPVVNAKESMFAQDGGTATTIVLGNGTIGTSDGSFVGCLIGFGVDVRVITGYVAATKTATVDRAGPRTRPT